MFGDAAGIQHDVARELRVGALEESGHSHRQRIDRAQVHRDVIIGNHLPRLRQREIAVGTAEREEQING
jgi:hypothetical protein